MLPLIGLLIVFGGVFGGYMAAGGKMGIIIKALPFEMMMIGGAAVGAFLISNKGVVLKASMGALKGAFGDGKWKKQDYMDLLCLMFAISKLIRTKGLIAMEQHIENPENSALFQPYPRILKDAFAVEMICDTIRMMTMNFEDPGQVKDMMNGALHKHHHEAHAPAHSVHVMAEGIPALGIVAAVLGVIKTMASINEPVEVLGAMIGGALVGTFLGVFLSYGIVGPLSSKMEQVCEGNHMFYLLIRDMIVSHLRGNAPQITVELGRIGIPTKFQPTFADVETALESVQIPG